jgi:hypothetical protein
MGPPGKSHDDMQRWATEYGPVYRYFLGRRPCVVISGAFDCAPPPLTCASACRGSDHLRMTCCRPRAGTASERQAVHQLPRSLPGGPTCWLADYLFNLLGMLRGRETSWPLHAAPPSSPSCSHCYNSAAPATACSRTAASCLPGKAAKRSLAAAAAAAAVCPAAHAWWRYMR